MNILIGLVVGVLTGLCGLLCSGFVTSLYTDWYRVTSREGASGFMVLINAVLGGVVALILGCIVAGVILSSEKPSLARALAYSNGIVVGLSLAILGLLYVMADLPPKLDGCEMNLEVEIKLPVGAEKPEGGENANPDFRLGSLSGGVLRTWQYGEYQFDSVREENGRWILPAKVMVFTTRGERMFEAKLREKNLAAFLVSMPKKPGREFEQWSKWLPVPREGQPPWPDDKPSYRFRVAKIPLQPPPPTQAELEAQREQDNQDAFDSIAVDAPVQEWFPFLGYGVSEKLKQAALTRLTSKAGYVDEMGALMRDEKAELASETMRLLPRLPHVTAEFHPHVSKVGQDLIQMIEKVNATPVADDPSFERAAECSIRFSGWMEAVRCLRAQTGGDFTTELGHILKLSRIRTDSFVMQQDIRRVASYYMKEWAGVTPEPGDPPPK